MKKLLSIFYLSCLLLLSGCQSKQSKYEEALDMLANNEHYKAIEVFESLGNYSDSMSQALNAKFAYIDYLNQYNEVSEALKVLDTIDASNYTGEDLDNYKYQKAHFLYKAGENEQAEELLKDLTNYEPAKELIKENILKIALKDYHANVQSQFDDDLITYINVVKTSKVDLNPVLSEIDESFVLNDGVTCVMELSIPQDKKSIDERGLMHVMSKTYEGARYKFQLCEATSTVDNLTWYVSDSNEEGNDLNCLYLRDGSDNIQQVGNQDDLIPQYKYNQTTTVKIPCGICNGSGLMKFYYGGSTLEAILAGQPDYTVGKCSSCKGKGYSYEKRTETVRINSDSSNLSGAEYCPSCGKAVSRLVTKQDKAGVSRTWCSSCWSNYDSIMN